MCIHCEVDCGGACVCCHPYKEAIIRIEELHKPDSDGDCTQCAIGAQYGTLVYASYPCKTIKELYNEE